MHTQLAPLRICLYNIWGHRQPAELAAFLRHEAPHTDVFCFTEVTDLRPSINTRTEVPVCYTSSTNNNEPPSHLNGLAQLNALLGTEFRHRFHSPHRDTWTCTRTGHSFDRVGFGSALFLRRTERYSVLTHGAKEICQNMDGVKSRMLQYIVLLYGGKSYLIAHLHGLWLEENTKGDDLRRDQQSHEVSEFIRKTVSKYHVDKVVFGGDLNLDLKTRAIRQLEAADIGLGRTRLLNLVREARLSPHPGTRTQLYRHFEDPEHSNYADYAFVSNNCHYRNVGLEVQNDVLASDHAPLFVSVL